MIKTISTALENCVHVKEQESNAAHQTQFQQDKVLKELLNDIYEHTCKTKPESKNFQYIKGPVIIYVGGGGGGWGVRPNFSKTRGGPKENFTMIGGGHCVIEE